MHIVIMGCGRVGSTLAHILEDRGNTVSVIDRDPEAFRRLRSSFKGDKITGVGFDRAVLTQAGIERADAFVAATQGDNHNIMASQIAKQLGGVTRNAVIGKVHRLGLSGRATPSKPARTTFKAPRPARPRHLRSCTERASRCC